jgi:hypothetical protein
MGDEFGHSLSPSKDRLTFRIVGGQMKLEALVQVVAEEAVHLAGVV